jgi:small subunit ribosomal protein S2
MVISLEELAKNAVHFGHKTARWNPKMKKYIYGSVKGVHVFDLNKTAEGLKKTITEMEALAKKGKTILFISTKPQTKALLEEFQESTGYPIVVNKWVGGMMTNFETIKGRIKKMKDYESMIETGDIEKYTKKEQSEMNKELVKLQEAFSGIRNLFKAPDAVFVVDGKRDLNAVLEAKRLNIPVYGIADSNVDPDNYNVVIPGNDDAVSSLALILSYVFEGVKNNPRLERQAEKK